MRVSKMRILILVACGLFLAGCASQYSDSQPTNPYSENEFINFPESD